jgi:hypothetical protein
MGDHVSFGEYFRESMEDQEIRRLYRKVLDEDLVEFLAYMREMKGLTPEQVGQPEPSGLSASLEELARYAHALGFSLRIEFCDEMGRVVGRYSLSPDEPVAENVLTKDGDISL